MTGRPLDLLEETVGDDVEVRLKSGETYRGILAGYDQHMNLVLEGVAESPAGDSTDASEADSAGSEEDEIEATDTRDTTIIRGDNVVSITP